MVRQELYLYQDYLLTKTGNPLKKDSAREYAGWVSNEIPTVEATLINRYIFPGADHGFL